MALRHPRALPAGFAQTCENVWFGRGDLRPLERPRFVTALAKAGAQTIYRFGQALDSETQWWFHWTTEVDVVRPQVPGDVNERTIWTGDGVPKWTTTALGTAGADLPAAARPLAIPPPTAAPVLSAVAGTGTEGDQRRTYVYTLVDESVAGMRDESAPSPLVTITCRVGQHVQLDALQTTASNGRPVTSRVIYRAEAGELLFVAEIDASAVSWTDTLGSDEIGPRVCPSVDWDPPPDDLRGLVALPNKMLAGLSGGDVRFCEPERPFAWPADYCSPQRFSPVGLGVMGTTLVVLTTGTHRLMAGVDPLGMSEADCPLQQPCVSRRSIVSTEAADNAAAGDVLFASADGLCSIAGNQVLTADLFAPEQWRALFAPSTIVGAWHQGWYIGTYQVGAGRAGFMFNPATKTWVDLPQFGAVSFYRDTRSTQLFCVIDNAVHVWRGATDVFPMRWRGGVAHTEYVSLQRGRVMVAEGVATVTLEGDGSTVDTTVVSSVSVFPLAYHDVCREWVLQVAADAPAAVMGAAFATSVEELALS